MLDMIQAVSGGNSVDMSAYPEVRMLDKESFESFVSEPDTVAGVMFVSPWCFVCGPLVPLWGEAAKIVSTNDPSSGSPVKRIQFGLIDVTKNPGVAEENNIHAFPTMKLFVDEEVFMYTHESPQTPISTSVLVNWVNKHTKRRNVITSESQLKDFLKENHLVVAAMLDESDSSKQLKAHLDHSSLHFEDVFFIEIYKPDLQQAFANIVGKPVVTTIPTVVMVYDHDDKYATFNGAVNQASLDAFIKGRRLLTVNIFQPGTIEYILDAGLPMLYLISPEGANDEAPKAVLRQVASEYLGKFVAVTVGTGKPWEQKLAELLDVKEIRSPVVRILTQPASHHHDHDPVSQSQSIIRHGIKYRPHSDDITVESLRAFLNQFIDGQLSSYVRSEPEPDDPRDSYTPGSILVNAVASNFDRLVTDDIKRDVMVVFHAPWCGFCRKLMPTLRELGEKLSHTGKGLKIVKIDATRNEVPGVIVGGYPTIILYRAVSQRVPITQRPGVHYEGDRSVEDMMRFLHGNAVNQFSDTRPAGSSSFDSNEYYSFEEL